MLSLCPQWRAGDAARRVGGSGRAVASADGALKPRPRGLFPPARLKEVRFHSSGLVRRRRAGDGCSSISPGTSVIGEPLDPHSHGLATLDRIAQAPLNSGRLPSLPARWGEYGGSGVGCCEERFFAYSGSPVVSPPPAVGALRRCHCFSPPFGGGSDCVAERKRDAGIFSSPERGRETT